MSGRRGGNALSAPAVLASSHDVRSLNEGHCPTWAVGKANGNTYCHEIAPVRYPSPVLSPVLQAACRTPARSGDSCSVPWPQAKVPTRTVIQSLAPGGRRRSALPRGQEVSLPTGTSL